MDILQGKLLIDKYNHVVRAERVLRESKIILFFFSAAWCHCALQLLPKLKRIYEEGKARDYGLEIIFVSFDETGSSMMDHFEMHGDWYTFSFGDVAHNELRFRYNVTCIPYIIVATPDGTLISKRGYNEIEKFGIDVLVVWS